MRGKIDHIVIGAENLISGTKYIEKKLDTKLFQGGEHKFMATHNKLLKLQKEIYLEVISSNPNVSAPSHPRWFSLDKLKTKKQLKKSPKSLCWILAVDNIKEAVENCGYYPGKIFQLSRDKLKWKVTLPNNGELIENGVLPFLIEWPKNIHPSNNLNKSNIVLNKISLFHPEIKKIKNILNNLIQSDIIDISEGKPEVKFTLKTQNGKTIIN